MLRWLKKKRRKEKREIVSICFPLLAEDKWDAIRTLVYLANDTIGISDVDTVIDEVVEREKRMSTGFEYGIAIPHCKTDCVKKTVVSIGVVPQGMDFDSIDKQDTKIIVLVLSPKNQLEEHVKTMANITQILAKEATRKFILETTNIPAIKELFINLKD